MSTTSRTPTKTRRRQTPKYLGPTTIGTLIILFLAGIVYISYTAQNGLPLQPTYRISVDVQNASEMTKNSDVRIGGARVGQVLTITAEPGKDGKPPVARLGLALKRTGATPLPTDTHATIRLASLLGGKYLQLDPGTARETVPEGGVLPVQNSVPIVDVDQAFRVFGGKTRTGIRRVARDLGNALAGRGTSVNDAILTTRHLLPPLNRVLTTLDAPDTRLGPFIAGANAAVLTLAPVADRLNSLVDHATTTLDALDAAGDSLDDTLAALPPTEAVGTRTFRRIQPVLADAASLARNLRPAASRLPAGARSLDRVILASTPVLKQVPKLAAPLKTTFGKIDVFAKDPNSVRAIQALDNEDLATFSASLFLGLGGILKGANDAQLDCNAVGLWARNLASTLHDGDASGSLLSFALILSADQTPQQTSAAPDLHFNPYPTENASACEAGNERFAAGQAIGHPAATNGKGTQDTAPPQGATARAARAGLVGTR